jgi:hypothetical protein
MDDKGLQVEGKFDKAKGEAREALGDAKEAAKRTREDENAPRFSSLALRALAITRSQ